MAACRKIAIPTKVLPYLYCGWLYYAHWNEYRKQFDLIDCETPYGQTADVRCNKYGGKQEIILEQYAESTLRRILKRLKSGKPEKVSRMTRFLTDFERKAIIGGIEGELATIEEWGRSGQL